ncbi:MAG TPA: hypothetical protein VNC41_19490, partial [Acidimicrobiia bacterium]|nr:hypothetical protein [Acidimicrobiia bacterium]
MRCGAEFRELIDAPLPELTAAAAAIRDRQFGSRITFSPKIFVPLTMLCRDRCGYCTFAKPPARLDAPYLTEEAVLELAARGAALGCFEALFTLGEAPEARYPQAADWLAANGYASTVDYLAHVAGRVLAETGLLPHANAGALSETELAELRAGVGVREEPGLREDPTRNVREIVDRAGVAVGREPVGGLGV